MYKDTKILMVLLLAILPLTTLLSARTVFAHDSGHYSSRDYRGDRGYYPYYPHYRHYNPVVRRDSYSTERYSRGGTRHEEDVVVDKHASYYSPGRNEAVTRPRTKVETWSSGPGQRTTREKTSWIGADGRPHSTTVTRDTTVDSWGDTHTETHVALRKVKPKN